MPRPYPVTNGVHIWIHKYLFKATIKLCTLAYATNEQHNPYVGGHTI